jgi:hypothetical protein
MKSWFALGLVACTVPVAAFALDDEKKTIKEVMGKLHKGSTSQQNALKKLAQATPPDWDAIGKVTKDFVILGAALGKNDPPKGDKESWKKLSQDYLETSEKLDKAASDKDLDKLKAAQKTMGASCKACHNAHKDD